MLLERVHQRRQRDGQLDVVKQPAQVFQRVGHALQKMSFALVEAAKSVSAQRLHDADVNVGVVVLHEHFAIELDETGQRVEIVIEQLLAQLRRQIGLGVVEKRRDVVLQRAFAAALIIQKKWLAVAQHDVARLEIAIEKIIAVGAQQELRQAAEIVFQRLLVEGNAGEPKKVILEIIQIPGDGLAIEAGARIAHFVVQIAAGFDLKARQHGHDFAIGFNRLGSNLLAGAIVREKLKKRRVAKVFFEISAVAQIFGVNLRHRQTVPAKMPGKFEEGDVLFAHVIQNANRAELLSLASRMILRPEPPSWPCSGCSPLDRRVEMLLEKLFENVHNHAFARFDLQQSPHCPIFRGR